MNFDLEKSVFCYAELPIGLMCEVFGAKTLIFSTSLDGPKVFIFTSWNEQIACIICRTAAIRLCIISCSNSSRLRWHQGVQIVSRPTKPD